MTLSRVVIQAWQFLNFCSRNVTEFEIQSNLVINYKYVLTR